MPDREPSLFQTAREKYGHVRAVQRPELTDRERALTGPRSEKVEGSPEWCWQTIHIFKEMLRHVGEEYRQAEQVLDDLRRARVWERVPPDKPYGSLDALLRAETGLGESSVRNQIRTAREKYARVRPAAPEGTAGPGRGNKTPGGTRGFSKNERNTAEDYVARLKRDAEHGETVAARAEAADLLEQIYDEKVTPNAVARQRGWRAERVYLTRPETVARKIRENFTPGQIEQLIKLLAAKED